MNNKYYQTLKSFLQKSKVLSLDKDQLIYRQNDQPKNLYIVENGLIGLFHTQENGKETLFRVFPKQYIFGHRSFFAQSPYHASTIALTTSQVTVVAQEEFEQLCEKQPKLLQMMLKILAKELGLAELRIANMVDQSANLRIAESLVYLKYKQPDYNWKRKEIADFAGSTIETVTRVMSELEKDQLLLKQGRRFDLVDNQQVLAKYL